MKSDLYLDDGTPVDPDSIELPELCKKCKKNGRPDQEIACSLNRIDQQVETAEGQAFVCEAFAHD